LADRRPILVALTGLPATRKSAVAEAMARALPCPVYSVDPLEAVLLRAGITRAHRSDHAAYDLAAFCAEDQLQRGQSAIVDSVSALRHLQVWWAQIARRRSASFRLIPTVCSDPAVDRARLEGRQRGTEGFPFEPTWTSVLDRPYETPTLEHLRLDAIDDLQGNVDHALAYVAGRS